jgi:hypothetical protein
MKNKKIWVGVIGFIILFIIEYFNGILSIALECEKNDPYCNLWLPVWLYKALNPLWLFFIIIFIGGTIEQIVKIYSKKI